MEIIIAYATFILIFLFYHIPFFIALYNVIAIKMRNMQQLTPAAEIRIILHIDICLKKLIGYQSEQVFVKTTSLTD